MKDLHTHHAWGIYRLTYKCHLLLPLHMFGIRGPPQYNKIRPWKFPSECYSTNRLPDNLPHFVVVFGRSTN